MAEISIEQDGFLMRDSLDDTGVVPSPPLSWASPDLICHQQVSDPQTVFGTAASYASDPNQVASQGSRYNRVYARAKNLGQDKTGCFISVFQAGPSLFMHPNLWRNHVLQTADGETSLPLESVGPGEIGVCKKPFLLDLIGETHVCLVGVVSKGPNPALPKKFSDPDDYGRWVRKHPNVCSRNIHPVLNYRARNYESLYHFENPYVQKTRYLFVVEIEGTLPPNTELGLVCRPIGLDKSWRLGDDPQKATSLMVGSFNGAITTWVTLPRDQPHWPNGVAIVTSALVERPLDSPLAKYAQQDRLKLDRLPPEIREEMRNPVLLGVCASRFITAPEETS